MIVETTRYERKTFSVDAVQVTAENMFEVAMWCGGSVMDGHDPEKAYILVPVKRPLVEGQKEARTGNWVLKNGRTFKIYNNKAFRECFQVAKTKSVNEKGS